MCIKSTDEGCVLAAQQKELSGRVSKLETDFASFRLETQAGFRAGAEAMRELNTSVANLAHDFGARMNSMDARLVEEKVKWGDTLRKILMWSVKVILAGASLAMGVTIWRELFK